MASTLKRAVRWVLQSAKADDRSKIMSLSNGSATQPGFQSQRKWEYR